jgi:GTP pyrophosphokinase
MPKFNMYQSLHTTVIGPAASPSRCRSAPRDAPDGRVRHRGALEVQGVQGHRGRQAAGPGRRHGLAAAAARLAARDRRTQGVPRLRCASTSTPARSSSSRPRGDVGRCRGRDRRSTSPTPCTPRLGHRCIGRRVNGRLVPSRATLGQRRPRRGLHVPRRLVPSEPRLAELRRLTAGPQQDRQWFSKNVARRRSSTARTRSPARCAKQGLPLQRLLAASRSPRPETALRRHLRAVRRGGREQVSAQTSSAAGAGPRRQEGAARTRRDGDATRRAGPARGRPRRRGRARPTVGQAARCCTPVPGDSIIGFVTRGNGVSVHRGDCVNVASLRSRSTASSTSSGRRRRARCSSSRSRSRRSTAPAC